MKANVMSRDLIFDRTIPVPEAGCWLWTRGCHGKCQTFVETSETTTSNPLL